MALDAMMLVLYECSLTHTHDVARRNGQAARKNVACHDELRIILWYRKIMPKV